MVPPRTTAIEALGAPVAARTAWALLSMRARSASESCWAARRAVPPRRSRAPSAGPARRRRTPARRAPRSGRRRLHVLPQRLALHEPRGAERPQRERLEPEDRVEPAHRRVLE